MPQPDSIPAGHFRVIGCDTFPWPPEDYYVGDYPDFESAMAAAQQERQDMTTVSIYDDRGRLVCHGSGPGGDWSMATAG